jgi:cellulose synthase operon protein C
MKRSVVFPVIGLAALLLSYQARAESEALQNCRNLMYSADGASSCFRELLNGTSDPALRAEALWGMGDFQGANRAFQTAVRGSPGDADLRTRWGELYLAAYQLADARTLFMEALASEEDNVDAVVGLAEVAAAGFEGGARDAVAHALGLQEDHPGANMLLAKLYLESQEVAAARAVLMGVLATDVDFESRLRAYALLSAADHLEGALPSQWSARSVAEAPGYGDVYAVPAHYYVITRRYREAVDLLEQAVAIDADNFAAQGALGINLLRVNRMDDARRHLELAHAAHGFDARVVNTLRLLDSLDEFETYESDSAILRISRDESAVLIPYVVDLIDKAQQQMAQRYQFELQRPAVVELYPHHADFAVRTDGLPGIGILGAAFGDVVVMNGPSAQPADEFDWTNALWHELAHVYTLNATSNLVSRWFSEGVSVFEEWTHGPAARASINLHFIQAYAEGLLLPIGDLDEGFMRPDYENQIEVSYIQSGLVCQFIDQHFDGGLVKMLEGYRDGLTTTEAISRGLQVSPEELDQRFEAFLQQRFAQVASQMATLQSHMSSAIAALEGKRWADAIAAANRAIEIYPEYIDDGTGYLVVAQAARELQDTTLVRETLKTYWQKGGRNTAALDELSDFLLQAKEVQPALAVLRTLTRAEPLVAERHAVLGELLSDMGIHGEALVEFRSVLALEPFDRAAAHFRVARSLHELQRTREARLEVLLALEIAPRYRPALALLVEINK